VIERFRFIIDSHPVDITPYHYVILTPTTPEQKNAIINTIIKQTKEMFGITEFCNRAFESTLTGLGFNAYPKITLSDYFKVDGSAISKLQEEHDRLFRTIGGAAIN
jgi:hypothetical protein